MTDKMTFSQTVDTIKDGYKIKKETDQVDNQIRFGKYFSNNGVPQIELIVPKTKYDYESDDDVLTGDYKKVYLSVFRRYSFQVSWTKDGGMCLGASPVFGLETFTSIKQQGCSNLGQESTVKYIISCVAMDAIREYTNSSYGKGFIIPNTIYKGAIRKNAEWDKFIDETYKFCFGQDAEITEPEENY